MIDTIVETDDVYEILEWNVWVKVHKNVNVLIEPIFEGPTFNKLQ